MWTYLYTISSFEPRCFLQRVNLPICNILSVWMVQQRCVWLLTCSRVLAQASLFSVIRRYPLWAKVGVWISQQVLLTHPWPVLTRISRRWKAALVFCFALSRISNFSFCFTPCVFFYLLFPIYRFVSTPADMTRTSCRCLSVMSPPLSLLNLSSLFSLLAWLFCFLICSAWLDILFKRFIYLLECTCL